MFSTTLLVSSALILAVNANPIVSPDPAVILSLSRQFNASRVYHVLQHDRARARALSAKMSNKQSNFGPSINVPAINEAVTYVASVGVGSPPTQYALIIDTGSSNTWIGAGQPYMQTATSEPTIDTVSVSYGSGSFSGEEFLDTVTLGSLVITEQSIGVASTSTGFNGYDGILGIGPVDLTTGTLFPETSESIPTVTDNAYSQGHIKAPTVGISFVPYGDGGSTRNGELSFGGVDSRKFTGTIQYTPLTAISPANLYWGIDQSIKYGSTNILSSTAGIVDTGTTLILIASDAFARYQSATGGVLDNATGLLKISSTQYSKLQTLKFKTNGHTFSLTPNGQIWPRSLNTAIGGTSKSIYLVVADIGSPSGAGLDFINGYTFLERFYSVFDTVNQRVGFATTKYTNSLSN